MSNLQSSRSIPPSVDTLVIGGGSAGAALAGRLCEHSLESIMLLEAGPDYGAREHWPHALVSAVDLPDTHDWGYNSDATYANRTVTFERAKVIGGCSAHNGCAAIWGHRLDYDGWAALGNVGWATADLLPFFRAAHAQLQVRHYARAEATPFHDAFLSAASAQGLPYVEDLNNLDDEQGVGLNPANIVGGVRWNTAFAYLDPVRARPNLSIVGDALVERLLLQGERVIGVVAIVAGRAQRIEAGRVILAAGTYGSPAILLRSGIGEVGALGSVGVKVTHALRGVGQHLHDHPAAVLKFGGSDRLLQQTKAFMQTHWAPIEQTIAKAQSTRCETAFDLHIYPAGGLNERGECYWTIPVACMTPHSRGQLKLRSADPLAAPLINHAYLSDAEGHDRRVLQDGIAWVRRIAQTEPLRSLLGEELSPIDDVDAVVRHYYHPVGTCKMGDARDPLAVVDARGRVHGLTNLYVADASIMPHIPRANTNVPAVVIGERIAAWLAT